MSHPAIDTRRIVSPPRCGARRFAADAALAADARRWVAGLLEAHGCRDDAVLVVGELFANAVQHGSAGGATVVVSVRRLPGDRAYVAVTDCGGTGRPVPRAAGTDAVAGRGLAIVAGLAERWGARRSGPGWRVFALLAPDDPAR